LCLGYWLWQGAQFLAAPAPEAAQMTIRRFFAALFLAAAFSISAAGGAMAETIEDYKGENRLLLIFSPDVIDDRYDRQMQQLLRNSVEVRERDLLPIEVIGVEPVRVDALTEPDMDQVELRERFEAPEGGFKVVLLGKDGTVKMTSESPIPAERLFEKIDSMPMRQREMRERD
jgi:hypothetical protein